MQGTTWAAVAAGKQSQALAGTAVLTSKEAQLSAISKDIQGSADAKSEPRATNASGADNLVPKKDMTAGTKSTFVAVPKKTLARKNNHKKKESASVSKPPDSIVEKLQKTPDVVTPSFAGASAKVGTSKKKKPSANAAQSNDGNSFKKLNEVQADDTSSPLPVANEASTASAKKKNKSKSKTWKPRAKLNNAEKAEDKTEKKTLESSNVIKSAEKVGEEAEKNDLKRSDVINGVEHHALESITQGYSDKATTAKKLDPAPADFNCMDLEDISPVERTHPSAATSEADLAPDPSLIEAPTLAPLLLVETEPLKQPKSKFAAHKHSSSMEDLLQAVQDAGAPRARSVVARKRVTQYDVETYVASLGIPGISFDKYGVCIEPDAPKWVRGRVARRVQCLVSDFKADRITAKIDIATELELEKKEKVHFPPAVWDRLFGIEGSAPISDQEYLELMPLLREFDMKLAADLIPDSLLTMPDDEVGEEKILDNANNESSLSLPIKRANAQTGLHEQNNIQQVRGNNDTQVPPPESWPPSQAPLPSHPVDLVLQSSVKATANDNSYRELFVPAPLLDASSQQEHNQNSPQQHSPTSRPPCRNYANGYCYYGSNCHFEHVGPGEIHTVAGLNQEGPQEYEQIPYQQYRLAETKPCRNYADGYCPYGAACRFAHVPRGEMQAITGPYQQDSAYGVFDVSRSVSQSSNGMGMMDAQPNGRGQLWRAPSRMPNNPYRNARRTPDSHGSTQGSTPGSNTSQKKKKTGPKHNGGKKTQGANR